MPSNSDEDTGTAGHVKCVLNSQIVFGGEAELPGKQSQIYRLKH